MAIPAMTNNSPVAGSIAWGAFTIQYLGVGYAISAGSTSMRWVWWRYNGGSSVIQAGADIPTDLTDDDLVLFGNKNGIAIRVQAAQVVDGELIVDGSIFADAIAANQINSTHVTTVGLDAGVIKFGEMHGDRISAASVQSDRLMVGFVNLIGDASFANDEIRTNRASISTGSGSIQTVVFLNDAVSQVAGRYYAKLTRATTGSASFHLFPRTGAQYSMEFIPGQTYLISVDVRVDAAAKVSAGNVRPTAYYRKTDGTASYSSLVTVPGGSSGSLLSSVPTDVWTRIEWEWVCPSDWVAGYMAFQWINATATGGSILFQNPGLKPKVDADLIVDGSILTRHMIAGTISGDILTINTVNGDKILANSITGDKVAAKTISTKQLVVSGENKANDPGFESGTLNFHRFATNASYTRSIVQTTPHSDKYCAEWVQSATLAVGTEILLTHGMITDLTAEHMAASPGDTIHYGFWVYMPAGTTTILRPGIIVRKRADPATNYLSKSPTYLNYANQGWVYVSTEYTIPLTEPDPNLIVAGQIAINGGAAGHVVRIDDQNLRIKMQGSLIVDGTIDSTKVVTEGLDAGVIKFGEMSGERIVAGSITADKIDVTDLFAQTIKSPSITIGDGKMFLNDVDGFRVPGATPTDKDRFKIPLDATKAIEITAQIEALSAIFRDNTTIRGLKNYLHGLMTLGNGITDPNDAPSVSATWDMTQTDWSGQQWANCWHGLCERISPNTGDWVSVMSVGYVGTQIRTHNKVNGTSWGLWDLSSWRIPGNSDPAMVLPDGGIVAIGSFYYTMLRDYQGTRGGDWWIYKLDANFVKVAERRLWSAASLNRWPSIGKNDVTGELMLAYTTVGATPNLRVRTVATSQINSAAGDVVHSSLVDLPVTGNLNIGGVYRGTVYGQANHLLVAASSGQMYVFNASNVRVPSLEPVRPQTATLQGLHWDGTRFHTLDHDGHVYHMSLHDGSSKAYTYTLYDGANDAGTGVAESKPSPPTTVAIPRGARPTISVPEVPDDGSNDAPDRVRVYANNVRLTAGLPADGAYPVGTLSAAFDVIPASGTAAPTVSGFANRTATAPGQLQSTKNATDGLPTWRISGDGTGRVGHVKWNADGTDADDTGWVLYSVAAGTAPFAAATATCYLRRIGKNVRMRFTKVSTAAVDHSGNSTGDFSNQNVATGLPAALMPSYQVQLWGDFGDSNVTAYLNGTTIVRTGGYPRNYASGVTITLEGGWFID